MCVCLYVSTRVKILVIVWVFVCVFISLCMCVFISVCEFGVIVCVCGFCMVCICGVCNFEIECFWVFCACRFWMCGGVCFLFVFCLVWCVFVWFMFTCGFCV